MKKAEFFFSLLIIFSFCGTASAEQKKEDFWAPLRNLQESLFGKVKKQTVIKKQVPKESQVEGLRLEGVARGEHGGSDVAILNGEPYRAGDKIKDYQVLEVHPSYIRVENQKTHEDRLVWVNGKPTPQEMEALHLTEEPSSN